MQDTVFGYADIFSEEMFKYILHKTIVENNLTFSEMKEVAANFFSPSEFYSFVDGDYENGIMDLLIRLKYGNPIEVITDIDATIAASYEWDIDKNFQGKG